jgi:glycerol kinase
MSLDTLDWDPELLALFGIPRAMLARPCFWTWPHSAAAAKRASD